MEREKRNQTFGTSPCSANTFHVQSSAFYMMLTKTNLAGDAFLVFPNSLLTVVTFEGYRCPVCIPSCSLGRGFVQYHRTVTVFEKTLLSLNNITFFLWIFLSSRIFENSIEKSVGCVLKTSSQSMTLKTIVHCYCDCFLWSLCSVEMPSPKE